jgi:hypothetical protein
MKDPNKMSVRIVLARHGEPDIDWVCTLPEDYEIYLSDSGKSDISIPACIKVDRVKVPNGGRESSHWLRYIVENYDRLADVNVFLQAAPHIGHTPDILFDLGRERYTAPFGYLYMPPSERRVVQGPARTFVQIAVGRAYKSAPCINGGHWGGQHYAKREQIMSQPIEWYELILDACVKNDRSAYDLEYGYNVVYGYGPEGV